MLATVDASAATYNVSKIYAMIDCVSVDDGGMYQGLLQKRMESGPLEIAFTDYYTFNLGSCTGSFSGRFSVATNSMDAIHCTVLPANLTNTIANPISGSLTYAGYDYNTQNSRYFSRGFVSATSGDFQNSLITLNNIQYPASGPLTPPEIWNQTSIALGEHNKSPAGLYGTRSWTRFSRCTDYFFWQTTRLNSPGEGEQSVRTGQDTRGNAAFGVWQVLLQQRHLHAHRLRPDHQGVGHRPGAADANNNNLGL